MTRLRRLIAGAMTLLLLLGLMPAPARAAVEELDQTQIDHDTSQLCKAGYSCAQVFTAAKSGNLTRARVKVKTVAGVGDMVVELRELSGLLPTGTVLASETVAAASVPSGTEDWVDVAFSPAPTVSSGQQYALYLSGLNTAEYDWVNSTANPYGNGVVWLQDSGGDWGSHPTFDFAFETYVTVLPSARLSALSISAGDLAPAFDPDVVSYTATAANSTSSLTVSPTTEDPAATVTVNGGSPSTPVALSAGTTNISVVVTNSDSTTTKTYTLAVGKNSLPTITGLSNQTIDEDTTTGIIDFTIGDAESPVGELTVAASSLSEAIVPTGNITLGGSGADRTIRVTPAPDANGAATIEVQVSDGTDVRNQSFTVTVTPLPDPPTIGAISDQTAPEDDPVTVNFAIDDPDGYTGVTVSATSSNQAVVPDANLAVSGSDSDRTLTITPGAGGGTTTITVTVSDGSQSDSSSFALTLIEVNDAPVITGLSDKTINEDAVFTFSFTVADEETPAGDLSVTATSSNTALMPNNAVVTNTDGSVSVTMTPAQDQSGTATITVEVSDGEKVTSGSFTLTVAPGNDAPTISAIPNQTTLEDTPVGPIAVTIGDADTPLTELIFTATSSSQALAPNENIALGGSGANRTVTITPGQDQNGTVTITLRVSDGEQFTTATFDLLIVPVNDLPTIADIADVAVAEGATVPTITFSVADLETLADSLVVSASSSNQTLVPNANLALGGSGSSRTLNITPAAGQAGTAMITVTVSDGTATASDSFIFSVSQAPTISTITGVTVEEDTPTDIVGFTVDDAETAANDLIVSASSSNKTLLPDENIVLGGSGTNRTMVLTPAPNQYGTTTVTISVNDGTLTTSRSFTFTATPVNDGPTISPISDLAIAEDEPTGSIAFTVSDAETAGGALLVTATSSNQTLVPAGFITLAGTGGNRTINIRPALDLSGVTTITITVSDGELTASRSFVLTVTSVNDAPTISAPTNPSMLEDTSTTITVTATDPDSPIGDLSLTAVSLDQAKVLDANVGIAGSNGSWTISIVPVPNASGVVKIRVTVTDGATPGVKDISLNIIEVNDLPWISAFADQVTDEDVPIDGIIFTVGDLETAANQLQVYGASDNPSLVNTGSFTFGGSGTNRTVTISPRPDAYGTATVTISVDDGTDKISQTFLLTVNPVPDPPRVTGISDRSINEDTVLLVNAAVYAPDSNLADVVVTITSSNEELAPLSAITFTGTGSSRTLSITPTADASGTALITFTSTDGVLTGTQTMVLTVLPVNDTPFVSIITDRAIFEDTDTGAIAFTVGDVETDSGGLIITGTSSNQEIVPDASIVFGGSGPTRTVTVIPAPDRTGKVTITVRVSDGETTATESLLLTINPINDAPSFTVGPSQIVDEDAGTQTIKSWATNISAGPFETNQTVTFEVNSDNPSLFAVPPAVSPTGILTYTSQLNAYGSATVNLRLKDNGGLENGGVDTSGWQSFTITVLPVNDPPTITQILAQGTEEGVSTKWLDFQVDDVESGPGALWVTAASSDQAVVRDQDIILSGTGADRQVRITPRAGRIGTVTITLTVHDGEGSTSMSFPLVINDLKLSELIPEVGAFTPVFDSNTLEYTLVYLGSRTTIKLTPKSVDPDVVILVNDLVTVSGTESAPIPLEDTGGRVQIVVTAPATGLSKTYSIRFVRALSKIADLLELSVTPGTLSPAFDPAVTQYSVSVDHFVTEVAVNARPGDGRARVEIEGGTDLKVGSNQIQIRVRAENGEEKYYTVRVIRGSAPLSMHDVDVEAGAEWAVVRFATNDRASAKVTYQESGGSERTASSSGTGHSAKLGPLAPNTTYTFRIVASRGDETVDYTSTFITADGSTVGICAGGQVEAKALRTASVLCPASAEAAAAAAKTVIGGNGDQVSAASISDAEMREAMRQAGIVKRTDEPATMVVRTGTAGSIQAVVLDNAAVARAAGMGADLEVRSNLGSLTLPTVAVAALAEKGGRLVVLFEEIPADREDLKPYLADGQLRRASTVVDVSVATLFDDGRLERHSSFPVPVRLSLKVMPEALVSPDRLGVFWLRENTSGKVTARDYVGGVVNEAEGTITVQRDHLSTYVALLFDFQFEDVPRTHWAFDVIHQMAARQVIRGKTIDLFEPETPVTRAQFAAMLVRGMGLDKDSRFAYVYSDIKRGDPLAPEIGGAVLVGLMLGYPDGTFHPDAQLTRQELAVVLHRLAARFELPTAVNGLDYTARLEALQDWDAVAPWARDAVRGAIAQGLMTGRTPEAFSPVGIATRAEAATVVKRLIDLYAKSRNR